MCHTSPAALEGPTLRASLCVLGHTQLYVSRGYSWLSAWGTQWRCREGTHLLFLSISPASPTSRASLWYVLVAVEALGPFTLHLAAE